MTPANIPQEFRSFIKEKWVELEIDMDGDVSNVLVIVVDFKDQEMKEFANILRWNRKELLKVVSDEMECDVNITRILMLEDFNKMRALPIPGPVPENVDGLGTF